MIRNGIAIVILSVPALAAVDTAVQEHIGESDSLTNGFWGLNEQLEPYGLAMVFGLTQVYQDDASGGLSTHSRKGRYSGSYKLKMMGDLEKLLGLDGFSLYALVEGSWNQGINDNCVGSFFNVNDDAAGNESIDVTELWLQKAMLEGKMLWRAGKIDLTGGFQHRNCPVAFDCSMYANDETTQFLNSALVNNPTIPFPDNGLAAEAYLAPLESWYVSAAVQDAQADARETGFNTAFHGADYFFAIIETGIVTRPCCKRGETGGAYRVGLWYDPQTKERFEDGSTKRDDVGFYVTCDQLPYKENDDPKDTQGLGAFARYGWSDADVEPEVTCFWSLGFQYLGLFEGRDDDVLGVGFVDGTFSDEAADFSEDYESVLETYYRMQLTPATALSPDIQYVTNPGAPGARDAVVVGARLQVTF